MTRRPRGLAWLLVTLALLTATHSVTALAATLTWIGKGDGRSWHTAANWDAGRVPATDDDAVIPRSFTQVEYSSGTTTLRSLTADGGLNLRGGWLRLTLGESRFGGDFLVTSGGTLEASGAKTIVRMVGNPVEWSGDVRASDGATLLLSKLSSLRGDSPSWLADGPGTRIEAEALAKASLNTSGSFSLTARRQAVISLPALTASPGPLRLDARSDALIDLSAMRGDWSSEGFSSPGYLTALDGGRVLFRSLNHLQRVVIDTDSADAVSFRGLTAFTDSTLYLRRAELNALTLTNVNGSQLRLREGAILRLPAVPEMRGRTAYWRADDPGTLLDASAVKTLAFDSNASFSIDATAQGQVLLRGLTSLRAPLQLDARSDALIDLRQVDGRWTTEGYSSTASLTALDGGQLLLPGLSELDRVHVTLNHAKGLSTAKWLSYTRGVFTLRRTAPDLSAVSRIDGSQFRLSEGAILRLPVVTQIRGESVYWSADGPDTLIDARNLADLGLNTSANFAIDARNQARVDLSGLPSLRAPVQADARSGALIDLHGARGRWTTEGFSATGQLTALTGGRILLDRIIELDRIVITTDDAKALPTSQWTAFTRGILYLSLATLDVPALANINESQLRLSQGAVLRLPQVTQIAGSSSYWRADDPGTLLDARALTEIALNTSATFQIDARNQARIDLSGVRSNPGPLQADARGGATIDLSGLRGTWSSEGFSNRQSLYAEGDGIIRMPGITEFVRGTLSVQGTGQIDTGQLRRILDSTVRVNGADAVLALGSLRDQSGSSFSTLNGGRLAFGTGPRILDSPKDANLAPGANLELTVLADGDPPLFYRWRKNGQILDGETNASLRLDRLAPDDAGDYSVIVANAAGVVESAPAAVTLRLPQLPLADDFAQRGRLTTESGFGIASNRDATREPGEPAHAGKRGGASLWITWRAPDSGIATFRTLGSNFDTLLAVYLGRSLVGLQEIASDDDSGRFLTSAVSFNAVAGTDYEIAIDGHARSSGVVVLQWELNKTLATLPKFTLAPRSTVVVAGDAALLSAATDSPNATYQWLYNGQVIPGKNDPTLLIPEFTPADAGVYAVRITTPTGLVIDSPPAVLEGVDRPQSRGAPSADKLEDLFLEDTAPAAVPAVHAVHPVHSVHSTPVTVGLPGSQWTDNSGSTHGPEDPVVCNAITTATRWLRFRFNVPGVNPQPVQLTTVGSEIATLLAVFTNHLDLQLIACDVASPPAQPAAAVEFPAQRGVDYLVLVDGVDGATGQIKLNWDGEEAFPAFIGFQDGRFTVELPVAPGLYQWETADSLGAWSPLFQTNVATGVFRFQHGPPPADPHRFFRLQTTAQ